MADKFRRKSEPKHIRLYASVTGSEAWKHLSGNAVKVLLALVARDNGTRNGQIGFSGREAAIATGLSDKTCWRCLIELQELGFIACTEKGAFSRKVLHSTMWRYTWAAWPEGKKGPTRDFEQWRCDEKRGCKICCRAAEVSSVGSGNTARPAEDFTTARLATPLVPVVSLTEDSSALIIHQGKAQRGPETDQRKQANSSSAAIFGDLRERLAEHLNASEPGEQTRLAERLGIPGGTLSRFRNGRNLPDHHAATLAKVLT